MHKFFTIVAAFSLTLTGCGVTYLGKVGDTKFYSVGNSRLDGPNFNALVTEKDNKAHVEQVFSGPGILTTVGSAAITAGTPFGAAYIESQKKPSNGASTVNVTAGK